MDKKTVKRGLLPYLFLAMFIIGVLYLLDNSTGKKVEFTYDEFKEKLVASEVTEIQITRESGRNML